MDLGRQRAHTSSVRPLPIVEWIKELLILLWSVIEVMVGFRYLYRLIHSNVPLVGKHWISME